MLRSRTSSFNFLGLEKIVWKQGRKWWKQETLLPSLPSLTFSLTSILSPSLSLRRGMFQKMCSSSLLQRVIEKQERKRCVKSRRFLIFNSLYSGSWRIWCILLLAVCFSWVRKVSERGEREVQKSLSLSLSLWEGENENVCVRKVTECEWWIFSDLFTRKCYCSLAT